MVISAPSGAGKTSICRELIKKVPRLAYSVSFTTRPPRPGEKNGRDYNFITEAEFRSIVEKKEFLEWNDVYGYFYGTSRLFVESVLREGRDLLLDVDTKGASNIREACPEAVFIFILPPSGRELRKRLDRRGSENRSELNIRLGKAADEIKDAFWYDYIVLNKDLSIAVDQLRSIYIAEKCRRARLAGEIENILSEVEVR